jgi:hypothetical protein
VINPAGVFILKFDDAALCAAVAERFPLGGRQFIKGFVFPEGEHMNVIP